MATGSRVSDFDVFSPDPGAVVSDLLSRGFRELRRDKRTVDLRSETMREKVQVILAYRFESPEETISAFDFTIVCAAWAPFCGFVHHERFWQDVASRRLVVNDLPKPLSTLQRAFRYTAKGYRLCPIGLGLIVRAISDLKVDWNNPAENDIEFYPSGAPKFRGID